MDFLHREGGHPDPFPDTLRPIVSVAYVDDLKLARFSDAVNRGDGLRDPDYIVAADYEIAYRLNGEEAWRQLVVPAGMLTDLASVPAPFRGVIGRVGPHLEAAIVHDYLYVMREAGPPGADIPARRKFADRMMLALMDQAKVFHAPIIFGAVRLFGGLVRAATPEKRFLDLTDPAIRDRLCA